MTFDHCCACMHAVWCRAVVWCGMMCCIMWCTLMLLWCTVQCRTVLALRCCVVLYIWCVVLCCVVLYILCCAVLCWAGLCCVIVAVRLCCAVRAVLYSCAIDELRLCLLDVHLAGWMPDTERDCRWCATWSEITMIVKACGKGWLMLSTSCVREIQASDARLKKTT